MVKTDGVWIRKIDEHTLSILLPEELAIATRHPEKDLSKPVLAFPATRQQLNKFLAFYHFRCDDFPNLDELNKKYQDDDFSDLIPYEDELIDCGELLVRWCGRNFQADTHKAINEEFIKLVAAGEVVIFDSNYDRFMCSDEVGNGFFFTSEQISRKDAERARVLLGIKQHGVDFVGWHGEQLISVYGAAVRMAWADFPEKAKSKEIEEVVCTGLQIYRRFEQLEKAIEQGELTQYDPTSGDLIQEGHSDDFNLLRLSDLNQWLAKNIPKIRIIFDEGNKQHNLLEEPQRPEPPTQEQEAAPSAAPPAHTEITEEPPLIARKPLEQRKWIEFHVKLLGYSLENFCNLPNGVKAKIKGAAGKKGISASVIDERWAELRKNHQQIPQFPQ